MKLDKEDRWAVLYSLLTFTLCITMLYFLSFFKLLTTVGIGFLGLAIIISIGTVYLTTYFVQQNNQRVDQA